MLEIIASPINFMALLTLFVIGAFGALILRKDDASANLWSSLYAIVGSVWGIVFALTVIFSGHTFSFAAGSTSFPLLSLTFNIDTLSAFFIFVISLIALFCSIYGAGYVKHYFNKYNIGALGFFYNLFIAGMLLVVSSANGIFFLIAWEIMSVTSYFLVVYDRDDENNVRAGFTYLVMTTIGTAFIILSFLLMYQYTGSFDFTTIKQNAGLIPLVIKNAIFICALIGFGTKAGIIPFHVWLPLAHPAAPSHVSGLMSGVMIKTGIFMMIRLFLDLLQPIPFWWGITVIVIGSISAVLGILYALTEHDLKKLLAYSSIENMGIILLGIGSAMTFTSLGLTSLALLSLVAALFHTLNHAIFKSLLFLSAGSVINQTHTRNIEEYGGLIKYMPQTAFFFLIGAMAISALPPFNGFFSEWLTFQALFQGIFHLDFISKWVFVLAAGSLAVTGGLALACFVKVFGATFLARPRSSEVAHAKESSFPLLLGLGSLALLSLLFGVFSGKVVTILEKVSSSFSVFQNVPSMVATTPNQGISIANGFSSVSELSFLAFFVVIIFFVFILVRFVIYPSQKVTVGTTWDCGTDLTPRMEITSTGFARSIIMIFKGVLKPSTQQEIEYHDVESRYFPKSRTVTLSINDIYQTYLYLPIRHIIRALSLRVKTIQSGNVNVYIIYIFIALVIALLSIKL